MKSTPKVSHTSFPGSRTVVGTLLWIMCLFIRRVILFAALVVQSFVVHKRRSFVESILPTYFRTSKFASFQRQLNLYGFRRMTTGQDRGGKDNVIFSVHSTLSHLYLLFQGYYHDLFLRGRGDLCKLIVRQQVKGTGPRKPDAPEKEPNFYEMEFMPDSRNEEEQKMSTPTALFGAGNLEVASSTSLSSMMMESAARAPRNLSTESSLLAPLYPATSSASFLDFRASPSVLPALQHHQQGLGLVASAQHGFDPVISGLRAASHPYGFPLSAAMLSTSTQAPIFPHQRTDSYGFPYFPFQSIGGFDFPNFLTMPSVASMPQPSLRDILQRDSLDASIFNITAVQPLRQNQVEDQGPSQTTRDTVGGEHRSDEIVNPDAPATGGYSPHARPRRSSTEETTKRSSRKRHPS